MSNFSFKGDTLHRLIPSGGIDLFIWRRRSIYIHPFNSLLNCNRNLTFMERHFKIKLKNDAPKSVEVNARATKFFFDNKTSLLMLQPNEHKITRYMN